MAFLEGLLFIILPLTMLSSLPSSPLPVCECRYFAEVQAMEEKLSNDGYSRRDFETTLVDKPFRSAFLQSVMDRAQAKGASLDTVCEIGFGAGHSALFFLLHPAVQRLFTYDTGLARYTVPAHDYLDSRFPEQMYIFLGESHMTLPSFTNMVTGTACKLIYIDGSGSYEAVWKDLQLLARISAPDNMVVLAGAGEGSDALRAWKAFSEAAGSPLAWEGTVMEAPTVPLSDALVYGTFTRVGRAAAEGAEVEITQGVAGTPQFSTGRL